MVGLAQELIGDAKPPVSAVCVGLNGEDLDGDVQRESVEIDLVHPTVHEEVADRAEEDEEDDSGRRPYQRYMREAGERGVRQGRRRLSALSGDDTQAAFSSRWLAQTAPRSKRGPSTG
jgi:hypothetical protein